MQVCKVQPHLREYSVDHNVSWEEVSTYLAKGDHSRGLGAEEHLPAIKRCVRNSRK